MIAPKETEHQVATMKGKRTKRSRTASPLPLTVSTTSGESQSCLAATSSTTTTGVHNTSNNSNSNSNSNMVEPSVTEEEKDMANCLIMLAQGVSKIQKRTNTQPESPATAAAAGGCFYECKTCSRCFSSFQALGGHRASHRKPRLSAPEPQKPGFSLSDDHRPNQDYFPPTQTCKINQVDDLGLSLQIAGISSNTLSASNNKANKVHACAICGSEFSSGQALGGHMRRHRPIATSSGGGSQSAKSKSASPPVPTRSLLCLDLNLPAAGDEQEDQQQKKSPESAKFIFGSSEKTLVFANPLVECRY